MPPFEDPWLAQDIRSIVRMRWCHAHTNLGAKIDFSLRNQTSEIHKDFNETTVPGNPVTYNLSAFLLCLLSNWLQRIDFSHHLSSIFPQARTVPVESSSHTSWTDKIKRRPPTYSHSQCGRYICCCSPAVCRGSLRSHPALWQDPPPGLERCTLRQHLNSKVIPAANENEIR